MNEVGIEMDRITKIITILKKLIERTQEGKIRWSETADPDVFIATVDTIGVIVKRMNWGRSGFESFKVEILNREGRIAEDLTIDDVTTADYNPLGDLIEQLHTLARRSALDAEATLDDLVQELDAIA